MAQYVSINSFITGPFNSEFDTINDMTYEETFDSYINDIDIQWEGDLILGKDCNDKYFIFETNDIIDESSDIDEVTNGDIILEIIKRVH